MNFTKSSLYMKAYVEILEIIKKIDVDHKVPSKLIDFFEKNKDLNYEFKLKNMDLKNQVLRETVIILAVLEQKYWANDDERKVLNKILEEDRKAEIVCHFCNQKYEFSEEDLKCIIGDVS